MVSPEYQAQLEGLATELISPERFGRVMLLEVPVSHMLYGATTVTPIKWRTPGA